MTKRSSRLSGQETSFKGGFESSKKTGQKKITPRERLQRLAIARFQKTKDLKVEAEPQELEDIFLDFKSQLLILIDETSQERLAVQTRQLDILLSKMIACVKRQRSWVKDKKLDAEPINNFIIIRWFFEYLGINVDNLTRENIMLIFLSFLQQRQKRCG